MDKSATNGTSLSNESLATMYRAGFKAGYDAAIEKLWKLDTLKSKYPQYLEDTRPEDAR